MAAVRTGGSVARTVVVVLLVLGVLVVAVDRGAAALAGWRAGAALQAALHTSSRPSVTIAGFPFVTQVLSGVYEEVRVSAVDVPTATVPVATMTATLHQVRLQGSSSVTASSAVGLALLHWADLAAAAPVPGVELSAGPSSDQVRVSRTVTVLGLSVPLSGLATVGVVEGGVKVSAVSVDVGGASLGSLLPAQLLELLTFTVPVSGLPGGVSLTSVSSTAEGLELMLTGTNVSFSS
jgi:hypothetical protein